MITIQHSQVTPNILALFDLSRPTMPRAFNVLEGTTRGEIIVDNESSPTWAVVREVAYSSLYFGGQIDAPLIAMLVEYFRQRNEVGIGCWLDDPLNEMLPPEPDYDGFTLYFTERSPEVLLAPLVAQLPRGYELRTRDAHLFAQSSDYDSTLATFGTVERVLEETQGMTILYKDTVACEASTGAPTQGRIEVGVETAELYRLHGLATAACAALIERCEAQGYATWWDCAKQNTASARLARKLGYRNEQEYRYVWWKQRQVGGE